MDWGLIAQWTATVASVVFGVAAWTRATRADGRAASAEERADAAEQRAARMEARAVERNDFRWEYRFQDMHTFLVVNRGLDTAHDVVILVRFDQAWDELRVAEMPRNVDAPIATSAGVEANEHMAADIRAHHARDEPAWAPEVTVNVELRIIWRTELGVPRVWESGSAEMPVELSESVLRLNAAADRGRGMVL